MEKNILNEINEIRTKMGLETISEESILLFEAGPGPVSTFIEKFLLNAVLKDVEKDMIRKFVKGTLSDVEKVEFKKFLNTQEGKNLIQNLQRKIDNETDAVIKMRLQAWLTNNLEKAASSSSKVNPFADIDREMKPEPFENPASIEKDLSDLRKASPNFRLYEHEVNVIPNLTDAERQLLKVGYLKYGKKTTTELIQIIQELRKQATAPQRKILDNIVNDPKKTAKWTILTILGITAIYLTFKAAITAKNAGDRALDYVNKKIGPDTTNVKQNPNPATPELPKFDPKKG